MNRVYTHTCCLGIVMAVALAVAAIPTTTLGELWSPEHVVPDSWYDAADERSLVTTGSAVTNWLDKSGKNRKLTAPGAGNRPTTGTRNIGGVNVLDFDGTSDYLQTDEAWFSAQASYTFFFVYLDDVPSDGNDHVLLTNMNGSGSGRTMFYKVGSSTRMKTFLGNTETTLYNPVAEAVMGEMRWSYSSPNTTITSWTNGTATSGGTVTPEANTDSKIRVGKHRTTEVYWDGVIAEILIMPSAISAADRQQVEGYLAHKWGLAAKLPAGHPYQGAPPLFQGLTPADGATTNTPTVLEVAFTRAITTNTTGSITITNITSGGQQVIPIGNTTITNGTNLVITPSSALAANTHYAVLIDTNAIKDLSGRFFTICTNKVDWGWDFTTLGGGTIYFIE